MIRARLVFVVLASTFVFAMAGCALIPNPSWGPRFASCMDERGWNAELKSDGGVATEWTDAQELVHRLHTDECSIAAGGHGDIKPNAHLDAYNALIANRECIIGVGIDLPKAPTQQEWRDGGLDWNPYRDLPDSFTREELKPLLATCPPAGARPDPVQFDESTVVDEFIAGDRVDPR